VWIGSGSDAAMVDRSPTRANADPPIQGGRRGLPYSSTLPKLSGPKAWYGIGPKRLPVTPVYDSRRCAVPPA